MLQYLSQTIFNKGQIAKIKSSQIKNIAFKYIKHEYKYSYF